jgi:hypothetical protein
MRNDRDGDGWRQIKEDLFKQLIELLNDKGLLDLRDNRLLVQSLDGHFYHSLNLFLNSDLKNRKKSDLLPLAGLYRFFQPSVEFKDTVMVGNCWIRYVEDGNYLTAEMEQDYTPKGGNKRENRFIGTVVPVDDKKCFWIDKDRNRNLQRLIKLLILQRRTLEDGTEEVLSLNGWCRYESEGLELARRVFLERASQTIVSEYYPKDHEIVPQKLRPYLTRNSSHKNVIELEPIRFQV